MGQGNTLVKELRTVDEDFAPRVGGSASLAEQRATTAAVLPDATAALFERLALDPNASVEKIERLMALWERTEARKSEALFFGALSETQKALRPVAADADNPQTRSRYASYAALDKAVRPVYTDHGFGLSFDTDDSPLQEHVRVLCLVSHVGGHMRTYHVDMPADGKGAKGGDVMTKTHAAGAAMSYGMRYLLKMIFNIAVGEDDTDGNQMRQPQPRTAAAPPHGFQQWWDDLTAAADEGWTAFDRAWGASAGKLKQYVIDHKKAEHNALKAKAEKVRR